MLGVIDGGQVMDWSWEKGGAYINVPIVITLKVRKPKKAKKKPRKKSKG
jgi:hypothetical protein